MPQNYTVGFAYRNALDRSSLNLGKDSYPCVSCRLPRLSELKKLKLSTRVVCYHVVLVIKLQWKVKQA
jgi:hypothetical protein